MEIEELDALQWDAWCRQADCGFEVGILSTIKFVLLTNPCRLTYMTEIFNNWVENADKLVKRYGPDGLYFIFPEMSEAQALQPGKAERDWK